MLSSGANDQCLRNGFRAVCCDMQKAPRVPPQPLDYIFLNLVYRKPSQFAYLAQRVTLFVFGLSVLLSAILILLSSLLCSFFR
jgi:hypothetical protein